MVKTEVKVKSSLAKRNFQKFIKNRLAIVGAIGVITIILLCILAPLLTPYNPSLIDPASRSLPPSAEHPLGVTCLPVFCMAAERQLCLVLLQQSEPICLAQSSEA